jgi:hypothetical protein
LLKIQLELLCGILIYKSSSSSSSSSSIYIYITVSANRPDILLYDKDKKGVDLIDIAVPLSHNIQNVYAQKINKYTELAIEIQQMWNVQKINIRPMVISVTGIVPQHLKTQLSELEITQLLPAIQRSVLLDTCYSVRQFLRNKHHKLTLHD